MCNGSWRQGAAHIQLALRPSAAWTLLLLLQNYRIGNHCIRHLIKLNELTALSLSQARCWEGVLRCGCAAQLYCTVCRGVMYPAARPHSLLHPGCRRRCGPGPGPPADAMLPTHSQSQPCAFWRPLLLPIVQSRVNSNYVVALGCLPSLQTLALYETRVKPFAGAHRCT